MKDGKLPPQRLSAKLNTDLDRLREENAALMASQLASFRSDLQAIATNALTTIEADTKAFQNWNEMLWVNHRQAITRANRQSRWMKPLAFLILTVTVIGLTWGISALISDRHQKDTLRAVGLELHRTSSSTFLILDPMRITATRCEIMGRQVPCLQVED